MNSLELKFTADGHIAYRDPRNPHLPIWFPGCDLIPVNIFGSVITENISDATDEATKPLCRKCESSIGEAG